MCTVHELNAMNYKEMKRIPRMILSSYLSTHGILKHTKAYQRNVCWLFIYNVKIQVNHFSIEILCMFCKVL